MNTHFKIACASTVTGFLLFLLGSSLFGNTEGLYSSPHLIFHQQMADQNALGAGSGFIVDTQKSFSGGSIKLGIRTMGYGSDFKDYRNDRLAAGPILEFSNIWGGLSLYGAALFFKETLRNISRNLKRHKQGLSLVFGWQRSLNLAANLDFGFGSYLSADQERSDFFSNALNNSENLASGSGSNFIWGRGLEISLIFKL